MEPGFKLGCPESTALHSAPRESPKGGAEDLLDDKEVTRQTQEECPWEKGLGFVRQNGGREEWYEGRKSLGGGRGWIMKGL